MNKAQILILLLIITLACYFLTQEDNSHQPKKDNWVIIKPKQPTKPTLIFPHSQIAKQPSQPTKATFGLNPPHSQLNDSQVDETINLPSDLPIEEKTLQSSEPSLNKSTLTSEEQASRQAQALSDYHWLLNNKTLADWHQELKLTDPQFQVLSILVHQEEMNTLQHFLNLLPPNYEWLLLSPEFKNQTLIASWTNLNFTLPQVQDWLKIGFKPTDHALVAWLVNIKKLTPEEVLNTLDFTKLKKEFSHYAK